jgi:ribosomal protein S18 acetylase RimI-like enzyme
MIIREATFHLKNGAEVQLRSPSIGDAAAMLAFQKQVSRESWRFLKHAPAFFEHVNEAIASALIEGQTKHPKNFYMGVWHDGAPIANLAMAQEEASLNAHSAVVGMAVLKEFHRLGVGALLMQHGVKEAERGGLWNVSCRVRAFNAAIMALLERQRFVRVGTLKAVAIIDGELCDEHVYQRIGEHAPLPAAKTAPSA